MPAKLRLVLPHGIMLAASVLLYWASMRIDVETGGRISPVVWPRAIIVFMGLLCAYEIVKRLVLHRAADAPGLMQELEHAAHVEEEKGALSREGEGGGEGHEITDTTLPPTPADAPPEQHGKLWGGIALVAGYVLAVDFLGFFVTTTLFLAVFPWVGGLRRPWLATALGVVGGLALVFVFMRVAYISLPLGEGPFRAVSLALLRVLGVA